MATGTDENLLISETNGSRMGPSQYFVRGNSPAMRALERTLADIAQTEIPILLVGESGTGKEVVALEVHRLSRRWNEAFVKCGCAGLSPDSLAGRLRRAENIVEEEKNGGSLFLDEINHLESAAQARLLHLLPDSNGTPPSGCCSVRVISSTTRNLEDEMRTGRFREELYYRINGVQLRLPPLRERKEDIPALIEFFFTKYASLFGRPEPKISEPTTELLLRYPWPGNIRELEIVARKIVALGDEHLATHDLVVEDATKARDPVTTTPKSSRSSHEHLPTRSLKEAAREASRHAERGMILDQLERTHWNRKRAARELQISYKALLYKLKQLGLDDSGHSNKA
jgi:two-component system response regulator AtoC